MLLSCSVSVPSFTCAAHFHIHSPSASCSPRQSPCRPSPHTLFISQLFTSAIPLPSLPSPPDCPSLAHPARSTSAFNSTPFATRRRRPSPSLLPRASTPCSFSLCCSVAGPICCPGRSAASYFRRPFLPLFLMAHCTFCPRAFSSSGSLARHVRTLHRAQSGLSRAGWRNTASEPTDSQMRTNPTRPRPGSNDHG